jgi:hypothetical protein
MKTFNDSPFGPTWHCIHLAAMPRSIAALTSARRGMKGHD